MEILLPYAMKVGALLKARKETIAVAESSTGGLIAAALLAVPGASAYFAGGGVLYTRKALMKLLALDEDALRGQQPLTEDNVMFRARRVREHLSATWGVSESGVAGPTGNRYGFLPGHSVLAVSGPTEKAATIKTGNTDRVTNMYAFATAALELLAKTLEAK